MKTKNVFNSKKQLIKKEYYNSNDELEYMEYNIYDKNDLLRVSGYKNFENGLESGYDVRDNKGNIRKMATLYDDESMEELYDKNGFNIKLILKDDKGNIKHKYKYTPDLLTGKILLTEKYDGNNFIYKAYHSYSDGKQSIVYKDASDKILGKQFVYMSDDLSNFKCIYTNASGKRCSFLSLARVLNDYDI